jgi:hypothetical protein
MGQRPIKQSRLLTACLACQTLNTRTKLSATGRVNLWQVLYTGFESCSSFILYSMVIAKIRARKDLYMKNIGFITTNTMLAQSLATMVKNHSDLSLEPFLLLDPHQATLDAEVLKIDIAVVDVIDGVSDKAETALSFAK